MDWSKAKTIMIIAFIITNLLLVYSIMEREVAADPTLSDEFLEKVIGLLGDSDIELSIDLPTTIPRLSTITVNYETYDENSVNKKFLDDDSKIRYLDDKIILENKNKRIILKDKEIFFEDNSKENRYENLDKEKALEISRNFLLDKGYGIDDISKGLIREKDGLYSIEYSKVYEDIYVENTYTVFKIDEYGVREFKRLWLEAKDKGDKKIQIGSASKAVLDLVGNKKYSGRKIVDISLCYYFDPIMDIMDMEIDSKEGRTVPAWRIEFDNGEKYIVNEY